MFQKKKCLIRPFLNYYIFLFIELVFYKQRAEILNSKYAHLFNTYYYIYIYVYVFRNQKSKSMKLKKAKTKNP